MQGTCPTIATGTLTFAGQQVQIWAGSSAPSQPGPLVLFWYGTSGSSADAAYIFGQAQINAVTAAGGIVAAIATSNKQGTDTGDGVWYTGDFATADQVVACALQQKWLDPRRIFTTGDSAGGLQSAWMAYARSGYLAAVAPLSGGILGANGFYLAPTTSPQDPTNVPAAIVTHGAAGVDVYEVDFAVASAAYEADIAAKGGFSLDCNTGGGHVSGPPQICPGIWQDFSKITRSRRSRTTPRGSPRSSRATAASGRARRTAARPDRRLSPAAPLDAAAEPDVTITCSLSKSRPTLRR